MFDPRILRVGFEIDGQLRMYDQNAWVKARGVKVANFQQNEATVQIANLDKDVLHYLLTETSPYNENRTPKRVVIEAGRESIGASRIYIGDITQAFPSQPPDVVLTVKSKTSQFAKGQIVAMSGESLENLSRLASRVASALSLRLVFEAGDVQVRNWSFTGASLELVNKLGQVGGVNAYVDDSTLYVKDRGVPLVGVSHVLSMATGMIGTPEATEYGCKVKMLFDPRVQLGGRLGLESVTNPAMDGNYTIYKLDFDLSSRDQAFYWIAHCTRDGWNNAKRLPK